MSRIDRRAFLQAALSVGATAAWGNDVAHASRVAWREQRAMFPEGVASGDPDYRSVLLWTRRPYAPGGAAKKLHVEVAEDAAFRRVVVSAMARVSSESDWTQTGSTHRMSELTWHCCSRTPRRPRICGMSWPPRPTS